MQKKRFSVKARIVAMAVIPAVILSAVILVLGILFMKAGMEEEIGKGLMASAYAYKDIAVHVTDREAGDNENETMLKDLTGYDYTWFDGDTRKNSSLGSSVIGTKAADAVIKEVINNGHTYSSTNTQVAGKPYFVAYVPVKDDAGNVYAMAFTGVSRESVSAQINKSIMIMAIISVALLIVAVIVAFRLATAMAGAVGEISKSIKALADGRFVKAKKYLNRNDEIGSALNDTNTLIDGLKEIVGNIRESASAVGTSSGQLSDMANQISQTAEDVSYAVQEIASGATQQADEIQNASTNVGYIGDAVGNVQTSTSNLENLAGKMKEASEVSSASLSSLQESSGEMTAKIDEISETIHRTRDAVDTISEKVEGITNIATQTNLLSLNASIEAARAGDAGKGFAVVAQEIGKLAEDSKIMADDIKKQMEELLEQAGAAVVAAKDVKDANLEQQASLGETIQSINGMINDINDTVGGVQTISSGAERCDTSKNAVVDVMSALSAISEENAASSEETGASMQELSATVTTLAGSANGLKDIADKLNRDMEFFKEE